MSLRKPLRRAGAAALTALAGLLIFLELALPEQILRLPPGNHAAHALVRIPVEALVATALLLALPRRPRRVVAGALGGTLGLLTIVKIVDIGFLAVLARRFDPVNDWSLLTDFYRYLKGASGTPGAVAAAAGAVALAVALPVLTVLAVRRLSGLLDAYAGPTRHTVAALTCLWVLLAGLGVQIVGGIPVAARSATDLARNTVLAVPQDLADRKRFAAEVRDDAFRDVPAARLLTALRGKDVIIGVVESYGRDALEDPEFNGPVLDRLGTARADLARRGFAARAGWLTSPTFGGGSWLAHATFHSGLRIDSQQRYRSVVSSDRFTLTRAFRQAGHRTVGVEPGITFAWPEGDFYGFQQVYDSHTLGYAGPPMSWSPMPDQFVLQRFAELEHARRDRAPLLAEITLTSSHTPWTPVPPMLAWDAIGDGAVYGRVVEGARGSQKVLADAPRVRQQYAQSVAYSLDSLLDYVTTYGDEKTVLVFFGDHQPSSVVVGHDASHDVPISIVAKDPAVLDRIAGWGWTDGLRPAPDAPVWPMDRFRDRFLAAYSPAGQPH